MRHDRNNAVWRREMLKTGEDGEGGRRTVNWTRETKMMMINRC